MYVYNCISEYVAIREIYLYMHIYSILRNLILCNYVYT